ncbi:MAG: NAD(P)/FAD-dependent oxidoreductase [Deltaproteobacteria bacterium]|jgi:L-2-hydroxyglutarate oxidase LhgO|nr:NAD(P)/FAD-dependent oxidoreductase [Deltaproteobacteria bacterium]
MTERLDCAVIGGGVVGLAIARRLALSGRQVVLFEAEKRTGQHASSRNSEVMHAGIYYPSGTLKARLCVAGRRMLASYCGEHGIPCRRVGKLVVAVTEDEIAQLEQHKAHGEANGVDDLAWLDREQVRALEPAVTCARALSSPSTGLVDSHGLMQALAADARRAGADIVLASPVVSGEVADDGIDLDIGGREPGRFRFRTVVNSAGFGAPAVARSLRGLPTETIPTPYFARGHYFTVSGPSPFRRLIYPVPGKDGLGIHVALDLGGNLRFGPDVCFTSFPDYEFDESRAAHFYGAIRCYYPGLAEGALAPGFVGVRSKLAPEGSGFVDFVLQGSEAHKVPGLLNLFGIDSPGLTSCLALAEEAGRRLE